MTGFHCLADNLRESFRALAAGKPRAGVIELPGVSIASLGVSFQMFNAAFPSQHIENRSELRQRLAAAADYFHASKLRWSFWVCEDWLAPAVRRHLSRVCEDFGLRLSSEMPGLAAEAICPPARKPAPLNVRLVRSPEALEDFRVLGSSCFHVPPAWFSEVFDDAVSANQKFVCWVGYANGVPVATAATISSHGVIGIYNVATAADYRQRGYAEAITRYAIETALRETDAERVVLQSTSQGLGLYARLGFRVITRVLVYNSTP
ncbi:MAG: GNAT family N-acetyltransferase [Acidobacteriota bacterium]|nr:GNAT family N-acetyltransferase [Acidobacteriota bacterium]